MVTTNESRLSYDRRQRLGQQIKVWTVSNFFPIERYYDVADTVYEEIQQISRLVQAQAEASLTFDDLMNIDPSDLIYDSTFNAGLDMTYTYAKRYSMLCVDAIPNHNYYNTTKYQALKHKHALQVKKILRLLTVVVEQMDVQEHLLIIIQEWKENEEQLRLFERHRLVQETDRKSTRLNSSHITPSRMPSSA